MRSFTTYTIPVMALAWILLGGQAAEARRRGLVIVNYGETVKHVADVSSEFQQEVLQATNSGQTPALGFVHSRLGLFWIDVWIWSGKYCVYNQNQYWELEPAQAAELLQVVENELSKSMLYTFPPGLVLLIGVLAVWGMYRCWRTAVGQDTYQLPNTEPLSHRTEGLT